jgi:hypothetical protein
MQSLVNDMMRRMMNTCDRLPDGVRMGVVDDFAQKMLNSGHSLETARKVAMAGLKGYERKKERSAKSGGPPLHRNTDQIGPARRIKKLL